MRIFNEGDPDAPDSDADKFIVEKLDAGGFQSRCDDIPSSLFSVIVGAKGATKKRLEAETQTKIVIPPPNQKGDIGTLQHNVQFCLGVG